MPSFKTINQGRIMLLDILILSGAFLCIFVWLLLPMNNR